MTPRWQRYACRCPGASSGGVVLFPVYWMLVTSLLPSASCCRAHPPLVPPFDAISLDAYSRRLPPATRADLDVNSAIVVAGSTLVSLTVATLAGYSLSRFRTPAQRVAGATLLLSKMLPGSLIVVPFFVMFTTLHLTDSLVGLDPRQRVGRRAVSRHG